jgi:hypothetical protein
MATILGLTHPAHTVHSHSHSLSVSNRTVIMSTLVVFAAAILSLA